MTLYALIIRLKRCLLIYLYLNLNCNNFYRNTRLERIEEEWWYLGGNIPKENQEFLSNDEKTYINKYKIILQEYGRSQPFQLDLLKV